jgi:hypothetical protein
MTELVPGQAEWAIEGDVVQVTIRCESHYAAMLLYDKLVAEGEKGSVTIKMTTHPKPKMGKA